MKGIFLLEFDDDDEPTEDNDHVEISLHALTGIHACRMMRLKMAINGHELLALVDFGSTPHFLSRISGALTGFVSATAAWHGRYHGEC